MRGGLTLCPHRYAKANKYMPNYKPNEPSLLIIYMDICGMYSSVQLGDLPYDEITEMTSDELENWEDYFDIEGEGCFLVVDLDYPLELYNSHNGIPMCPDHLNGRLDAHLWPRVNYGLYYKKLKSALNNGMILEKVHRGFKFKEKPFVKEFIELNTKLRRENKEIKFKEQMYKLKMNSVFGKFAENKEKRTNVKFSNNEKEFKRLAGRPDFEDRLILEEDVNLLTTS